MGEIDPIAPQIYFQICLQIYLDLSSFIGEVTRWIILRAIKNAETCTPKSIELLNSEVIREIKICLFDKCTNILGQVVQRTFMGNPGLQVNG